MLMDFIREPIPGRPPQQLPDEQQHEEDLCNYERRAPRPAARPTVPPAPDPYALLEPRPAHCLHRCILPSDGAPLLLHAGGRSRFS